MSNGVVLRKKNMLNVIKTVKNHGPVSKPEVALRTGMTSVSIHHFMNELLDKNIIIERGSADSNGGRKPTIYSLNPSYGYVIGQYLDTNRIRTALFDFSMEKVAAAEVPFGTESVNDTVRMMVEQIHRIRAEHGSRYNRCLGIGISVPGQADTKNGTVRQLTNLPHWRDVPLKAMIEAEAGGPVYVENDNKAIALAVKWMDEVSERSCIVYVAISSGVGAGILYNGELFRGKHDNAGEIGHMTIEYDGPTCNCGNRGCLELMISDPGVVSRVKQEVAQSEHARMLGDALQQPWDIGQVIRLGAEGNEVVRRTLRILSRFLIIGIDNIVKMYDPEEIILDCAWLRAFPELLEEVKEEYFRKSRWVDRKQLIIRLNTFPDMFVVGAATLVLDDLYKFSQGNVLLTKG